MHDMNKKTRLAAIGCGGRTQTYMSIAAGLPEQYENVAVADPVTARREAMFDISGNPDLALFQDDADILAASKMADIMIIGTQDEYHFEPCLRAMEAGYDILLEKPIADNMTEVQALSDAAKRLGRRVLVCHVLRYTPFYKKVKAIIESGVLGDVVSVSAREGVGAWHQAHSYVRGHWAVTEKCTPMIIGKSCHDLDILYWLIGQPCKSVSSYGSLSHFNAKNKPAGSPQRCTDGCPMGMDCMYHAMHYTERNRRLLPLVMDGGATASADEVEAWLKHSPWGRCVYSCDNTAVDHQVVNMEFEGDVTATFTMTAFDEGRSIEIFGTKGRLFGGAAYKETCGDDIVVVDHATDEQVRHTIEFDDHGYSGHGGGDAGLMQALHEEMKCAEPEQMLSSIHTSVMSHAMGFATEQARLTGTTVQLKDFK